MYAFLPFLISACGLALADARSAGNELVSRHALHGADRLVRRTTGGSDSGKAPTDQPVKTSSVLRAYEKALRNKSPPENNPSLPNTFTTDVFRPRPGRTLDSFQWGRQDQNPQVPLETDRETTGRYHDDFHHIVQLDHKYDKTEWYENVIAPDKGIIYCSNNFKGKRDESVKPKKKKKKKEEEEEEEHTGEGNCVFESKDTPAKPKAKPKVKAKAKAKVETSPFYFSDVLWFSYQAACQRAGYTKEHPAPRIRWIVREHITNQGTKKVLRDVFGEEEAHSIKGPSPQERRWEYASAAARRILGESPHGKGIVRFLTQHADTLGRRQIKMVGIARVEKKKGEQTDLDYDDPYTWSLKVELGKVESKAKLPPLHLLATSKATPAPPSSQGSLELSQTHSSSLAFPPLHMPDLSKAPGLPSLSGYPQPAYSLLQPQDSSRSKAKAF